MPTYRMAWECLCETGWYGPGCSIELEQSCDDKVDNDRCKNLVHSSHSYFNDSHSVCTLTLNFYILLVLEAYNKLIIGIPFLANSKI